jgi:hypothetical protein
VLQRAFSYIHKTLGNRMAFARRVSEVLSSFPAELGTQCVVVVRIHLLIGPELTAGDYREALAALCPDFPLEPVAAALRLLQRTEAAPADFAIAFRTAFAFDEFLQTARSLFATCDAAGQGSVNRAVFALALKRAAYGEHRLALCVALGAGDGGC